MDRRRFFENRLLKPLGPPDGRRDALDAVFPGAGNPHYFSEHLEEGLDVSEVPRHLARVDERVQSHRGHRAIRREDRALAKHESQSNRHPVLRGSGEGSGRARRDDRQRERRGLPRARSELSWVKDLYPRIEPHRTANARRRDGNRGTGRRAATRSASLSWCSTGVRGPVHDLAPAVVRTRRVSHRALDQRGCGRSTPHAAQPTSILANNTTPHHHRGHRSSVSIWTSSDGSSGEVPGAARWLWLTPSPTRHG